MRAHSQGKESARVGCAADAQVAQQEGTGYMCSSPRRSRGAFLHPFIRCMPAVDDMMTMTGKEI